MLTSDGWAAGQRNVLGKCPSRHHRDELPRVTVDVARCVPPKLDEWIREWAVLGSNQ